MMKQIMSLIWIFIILLTVELNCLQNEIFIPDLTLLSKKLENKFEYICAAGDNVRDSAIIFMTSPKIKNEDFVTSYYHTKDDQTNNKINKLNCNDMQCWSSGSIYEVINSENSPLPNVAPVIDERWENFVPLYIKPGGSLNINMKKRISRSFSLLSKHSSSLLLYSSENHSNFYLIELSPIIIFYCSQQDITKIDKRNCQQIKSSHIFFNNGKIWQHFNLIVNENISIIKYDTSKEELVEFPNKLDENDYTLRLMQEKITHNSGYVKIHDYTYLSLGKNKTSFEFGDKLKIDHQYNSICIEFYALTCTNCEIEFTLGDKTKVIKGVQQKKLMPWQYVKLFVESVKYGVEYRLKLKKKQSDILAIGEMRRCRQNEYRLIKLIREQETNIECQSLKYPSLLVSKKIKNTDYKGLVFCDDRTEIGNYCNISCQAITSERTCNEYTICKLNNEKKSVCSCPIGYKGKYCENKQPLPYLRDSLVLVNSTRNSITVRLESIVIEEQDNYKIDTFGIEFKENSATKWNSLIKKYQLSTNINITISNLKSDTEYDLRAVLYLSNYKCNEDENVKTAYFKTICKNVSSFIEDVNFDIGETNVTVTWQPICNDQLNFFIICKKNKTNVEWCENRQTRNENKISTTSTKKQIAYLSSFTEYELLIRNERGANVTYSFITKPSAQETAVQGLTVFGRKDDLIQIRWQPPQINNAIEYYQKKVIKKCKANASDVRYSTIEPTQCNIWPDWLCSDIPGTTANDCYQIFIRGMYEHQTPGIEAKIIINPNMESSPPENITFNSDTSSICWNHPNFIQGQLMSFSFYIVPITSSLIYRKSKNLFLNEVPQYTKRVYCKMLNTELEFSTSYEISIQTNSSGGLSKNKTLNIDTKPIKPELMHDVTIGKRTKSTQDITISQITPETITTNSVIYIQICNNNTEMVETGNYTFDNLTNCKGFSWIAAKITGTNQVKNLTIGDFSKNGDENFIENISLNQSVPYSIYVILINEYKGQESYNIYLIELNSFDDISNKWNPLYLLLLLLLIIPIIAFFIFKKRQNKFLIPSFINGNSSRSRNNNSNILALKQMEDNAIGSDSARTSLLNKNETETTENKYTNDSFSRIVKVANLSEYTKTSLENGELQRQHALFTKGATKPWEYGMIKQNKFKNRYNNLTAYDHSRVILEKMAGDSFSDFINANYIDGYRQKYAYIATQGPKPNTVNDFWRMIWQENVQFIVMLANLTEGGKIKCEKYWPDMGATQKNINLSIRYLKTDIYADFEYRTFEVTNGATKRMVQQLHFTSWPDHGVPLYPQSLVPFLRKMSTISIRSPIVVHCSAGVGRTGTIILTDICLRMAAAEGQIDVLKYLHIIRENRANMVDNFNQYKLVHMVLLEYLLAPDTITPCNENMAKEIENIIETGEFRKQLAYLRTTAWHNKVMITKTIMNPENNSKNRFPLIVPESTRIYISRYPYSDEYSDYINAIPVDGFQIKEQFIVTQNPLPNTLKDFWRMVNEQNSKVIVSLNDFESNDESCGIFWPNVEETLKPMPHFIIQHKAETSFDYFDVIKVQITNQNAEAGNEISFVKIIHYKNWKRSSYLPQNSKSLISLYEEAHNSCRDGSPMIITCFDGTTACGVFVALSFVIEKIKLEQLCDISLATRVVRYNREQFIINDDQFLFLYKVALEYVNSFEEYGNFQGPPITN